MAVSLLTISFSAFADYNTDKKNTGETKAVTLNASFNTIVVNNDIEIVLTEATGNLFEIKGEEKDINNISYYIKKGTLFIDNKHGSFKNKAVIYLSVSQLQRIEVNGNSKITSNGFLNSHKLKVIVNHEAKFDLKIQGEIFFETADGIYLDIEKWKGPQQAAALHLY